MTLIPLVLSLIAIITLWNKEQPILFWSVISVTILAWLVNQAVRNSRKMESTGESELKITYFWVKISMLFFVLNCGIAIWGIIAGVRS